MKSQGTYPDELRERFALLVLNHGPELGPQWEAVCWVSGKLG